MAIAVVLVGCASAAIMCDGSISGQKLDCDDKGINDWTINLYSSDPSSNPAPAPIKTTTTATVGGVVGHYEFTGLDTGTYWVCEELRSGYYVANGYSECIKVTLECNQAATGNNFKNCECNGSISGQKLGCDENGIDGWTINLYSSDPSSNPAPAPIKTTNTSTVGGVVGHYEFTGLSNGTYWVCEELQSGYYVADGYSKCIEVTLACNQTATDKDFKNVKAECFIGGYKYDDQNYNGIIDVGIDPLINNWKIYVTTTDGEPVAEAFTGKDMPGYWQICDLPYPSNGSTITYFVKEEMQDGWKQISPTDPDYYEIVLPRDCGRTDLNFLNDPNDCELTIEKVADKESVERRGEINYTITVCNNCIDPVHNVVVWDIFDKNVEILSVSPSPDSDGRWRFDSIPPNSCVEIKLKAKVPEKQDFEFGMEQGVSGEGFVNVANDYSTTFEAYQIKNCAYATSDWNEKPISDCVTITVGELGTRLETREYGSGLFDVDERVAIFTENKSIEWEEDLSAAYKPTTLTLYNNRTVSYDSAWVKKARAKNYVTGTTMTETYHDATSLDRESRMFLDENESVMEVESEFDGRGHIGFLKMPSNDSTPQTTPLFESSEDYTGSFKVLERIDEYGSSVSSEKAASGEGLVVVDKRVGDSQRSYESGSGSYDSEELIETATNYIAKDISLEYAPTSSRLTDDVSINSSLKWAEGMYSKNPESSYIGEEYTSITDLDKETVARGLNEMETEADFSGQARYRAVLERNGTEPEVDIDEVYVGDYSVERRVIFTGVAKYDRPHLNVTKTLDGIAEETLPWGYNEAHLAGETKTRDVASYTIKIENDGNKALGPVYVQDIFPPGSAYIEASIRPSELTETYANWTLLNIGIGDAVAIELDLDVSEYHPSELVNRVEVWGGINNGEDWVYASNFSALEVDWLTCRPGGPLTVETRAETNGTVVWYVIDIENLEDATRVATVTDHLPSGMELVESSVPFASYEDGVVVWNLVEIPASGTVSIEFSALAPGDGTFENSVEVDPRSVDGSVVQPVSATCVIDVGTVEDECGTISCDPWQPPNWEFEHYGYGSDLTTCEDLTCVSCD